MLWAAIVALRLRNSSEWLKCLGELPSISTKNLIQSTTLVRGTASLKEGISVPKMTQLDDELEALKKEEQTLEKMRAMVAPGHWPRIYAMLKRIRERMRELEKSDQDTSKPTAA